MVKVVLSFSKEEVFQTIVSLVSNERKPEVVTKIGMDVELKR